ncbi:MAG: trehalose-6-phosphate synthase [Nanoarchaeota archaeon]
MAKILNFIQNRVPFSISYEYMNMLEQARLEGKDPIAPNIGAGGLVAAELPLLHKDSPFDVNMIGVSMGNAEMDVLKGYFADTIKHFNDKWDLQSPFIRLTKEDEITENTKKKLKLEFDEIKYSQELIFMDESLKEGYYKNFANEFLWPLMHLTDEKLYETTYKKYPKPMISDTGYRSYTATNQIFAEAMLKNRLKNNEEIEQGGEIFDWAHDYHLMLFPMYYRKLLNDNGIDTPDTNDQHHIGTFWHIPFFNMDTVRNILTEDEKINLDRKKFDPSAKSMKDILKELTYGMLGSHSIAFHHSDYVDNFAEAVDELHPNVSVKNGQYGSKIVKHPLGSTVLTAYTIGIPFDEIAGKTGKGMATTINEGNLEDLIANDKKQDRMICVGLERFDYTKGIPYKLKVMDELTKITDAKLYQATQPSRKDIPAYQNLEISSQQSIDDINTVYGATDKPIIRLPKGVAPPENYELLRQGDAIMVTTEEDGCNVVVMEAIAAKASLPEEKRGFLALGHSGISRVLSDAGFGERDGVSYMSMKDPEQDAHRIKRMHGSKQYISDRLVNFTREYLNSAKWSTKCLETMQYKQSQPNAAEEYLRNMK